MGFFSKLVGNLFNTVSTVGKTVVNAISPVINKVVDVAEKVVNEVKKVLKREFSSEIITEKQKNDDRLAEVNDELVYYRKQKEKKGELTSDQKRRVRELSEERAELCGEIIASEHVEMAYNLNESPNSFDGIQIEQKNQHILQYHDMLQAPGKSCPRCGKPLLLKWRSDNKGSESQSFFWSCTGYFIKKRDQRSCNYTKSLQKDDFILFGNFSKPEFELDINVLDRLALGKDPKRIEDALRSILNDSKINNVGLDGYRCPIHNEKMVLKEKKDHLGLLDQFYLGCVRWEKDGTGCELKIKIKSTIQLSRVLESSGNGGLLHTLDESSRSTRVHSNGIIRIGWNTEDDLSLMKFFGDDIPISVIAKKMNRSEESVRNRITALEYGYDKG